MYECPKFWLCYSRQPVAPRTVFHVYCYLLDLQIRMPFGKLPSAFRDCSDETNPNRRKGSRVNLQKCSRWRQQKSNPVSNNVSLPRALHGAWVVITFNSKNSRETCLSTKLRKHQSEVDILLKRRHAFYVNPREDLKARTLRDKDSSFIYI